MMTWTLTRQQLYKCNMIIWVEVCMKMKGLPIENDTRKQIDIPEVLKKKYNNTREISI